MRVRKLTTMLVTIVSCARWCNIIQPKKNPTKKRIGTRVLRVVYIGLVSYQNCHVLCPVLSSPVQSCTCCGSVEPSVDTGAPPQGGGRG